MYSCKGLRLLAGVNLELLLGLCGIPLFLDMTAQMCVSYPEARSFIVVSTKHCWLKNCLEDVEYLSL